jgi:DNA gyrase subunit A
LGRNTQGVRVIRLKQGETLVGLARIEEQEQVDGEEAVAESEE